MKIKNAQQSQNFTNFYHFLSFTYLWRFLRELKKSFDAAPSFIVNWLEYSVGNLMRTFLSPQRVSITAETLNLNLKLDLGEKKITISSHNFLTLLFFILRREFQDQGHDLLVLFTFFEWIMVDLSFFMDSLMTY